MPGSIARNFIHYLVEALPWFAGGAFVGALVESWLRPETVEKWIGAKGGSITAAIVAGAVLPGCAMTTMPLAASLKARGASVGTLTGFIMIAPILSPHTIILNAAMLGLPMTVGRIVIPVIAVYGVALLINSLQQRGRVGVPAEAPNLPAVEMAESGCDCCCDEKPAGKSLWATFYSNLRTLIPFLLLGLLAVSILQALLPPDYSRLLRTGWTAYFIAAGIAIPLYVCEGAEVPLTAALLAFGVGAGPAFTFLLASVGTCIPTIAMAPRIIGTRATYIYVTAWVLLSVGGGMLFGRVAAGLR